MGPDDELFPGTFEDRRRMLGDVVEHKMTAGPQDLKDLAEERVRVVDMHKEEERQAKVEGGRPEGKAEAVRLDEPCFRGPGLEQIEHLSGNIDSRDEREEFREPAEDAAVAAAEIKGGDCQWVFSFEQGLDKFTAEGPVEGVEVVVVLAVVRRIKVVSFPGLEHFFPVSAGHRRERYSKIRDPAIRRKMLFIEGNAVHWSGEKPLKCCFKGV